MKHKALIGFDLDEYPEVGIFSEYFDCDFCEYSSDFFKKNISKYSISVPHLYLNLSSEMMENATNLKFLFTPSTGTNHLDIEAIENAGIKIHCLSDDANFIQNISSTAELAWLLVLAANRKIISLTNRVLNDKSWKNNDIRGNQLKGKTIGIIGFGRLGKLMHKYAKAFDMKILINDIDPSQTVNHEDEEASIEDIYNKSDIISLHPKLNSTSHEMINKQTLKLMKDGVIIVNTARGDVINSNDLLVSLQSGKVSFAALDVLKNEFHSGQLPDDPLLDFAKKNENSDKILITPHAGGATLDAHRIVFKYVAEDLNNLIIK